MPAYNRVTLVGNLTRDPETRHLDGANGASTTVTEFGLAVSRKFRTSSGEDREEVLFIDCAAFGKNAETLGTFARKGRLMLIEGRLRLDAWEEKVTGARRSKISVVVENFQFLGRDGGAESTDRRTSDPGVGRQQTLTKEFTDRKKDEPKARPSRRGARNTTPAPVTVNPDDIPF